MVSWFTRMDKFMKESGMRIKHMGMAFSLITMDRYMMVNGLII